MQSNGLLPQVNCLGYKTMLRTSLRMLTTSFTFHKALEQFYVSTYTNTSNFWQIIPFDPYFVHILKCVPYLCLKIACVISLYWLKQYKLHYLAISGQQLNIMLQSHFRQ